MSINYDDISDIRYNAFTGQYTPLFISNEEHVVPSSAPYIITLNEKPQQTLPSSVTVIVKETAQTLVEKSKTTIPGVNQFRLNYDELANGQLGVNSAQKGKTLQVSYNGLGTILKKETVGDIVFNETTFTEVIATNYKKGPERIAYTDDSSVNSEKDIKTWVFEIGSWDMTIGSAASISNPGINVSKVVEINALVYSDTLTTVYQLAGGVAGGGAGGGVNITAANIIIETGSNFNSPDFNGTGFNRGLVIIKYYE